jgi:hypothetical protein
MLIVNRQSWHAQVYRWWYKAKYESEYLGSTTNLCPYIRAVLLWAPFRFLFGPQWKIGKFHVSFATVPVAYFGLAMAAGYLNYELKVIMIGIEFGLVITGAGLFGLTWLENHNIIEKAADKFHETSFANLLTEYARSAHDQICPPVEFK